MKEIAEISEEKRGVVITLSGGVLFVTGKFDLLPIAKDKLNQVAAALKDQSYPPIRIEGHTDNVGSADDNKKLSQERADSVKDQLVSQGYPASKITTVGWGAEHPVADNGRPREGPRRTIGASRSSSTRSSRSSSSGRVDQRTGARLRCYPRAP